MRCISKVLLAAVLTVSIGPLASAQKIVAELSTSTLPTNPDNGFGGFTFGDFPAFVPAIISSPTDPYLTLDITDTSGDNGDNGVFGGMGVDFVTSVQEPDPDPDAEPGDTIEINQLTQNFDPNDATWELRLKIGDNNEATAIRTTMIDIDGDAQDTGGGEGGVDFMEGDEHVYEWDISGVPVDGQFHLLTMPVASPLFTQGAFGLTAGDTIVNPGLKQIQIQSVFGSTGRLDIEVEYARISVIPEPATLALVLFGLTSTAMIRRR